MAFFLALTKTDCTKDSECNHGLCNISKCVCYAEFVGSRCSKGLHHQKDAFLYQFFLGPFGAARFRLKLIASAVPQLIVGIVCVGLVCFRACQDEYDDCYEFSIVVSSIGGATVVIWFVFGSRVSFDSCLLFHFSLFLLLFLSSFSFSLSLCPSNRWIVDLILIGTNKIKDSNGYHLIENL